VAALRKRHPGHYVKTIPDSWDWNYRRLLNNRAPDDGRSNSGIEQVEASQAGR
jgi:hypothetical protein